MGTLLSAWPVTSYHRYEEHPRPRAHSSWIERDGGPDRTERPWLRHKTRLWHRRTRGAGGNAIGQIAFMANYPQAYPLWNILIVALNILVLYALTAHWRGFKESMV